MPANRGNHQHTAKAERMAEHIEESAKKKGRYVGHEEEVAWATVHKELPKQEAHRKQRTHRTQAQPGRR